MAEITYTRSFQHDDWVDNEDIVQAGGPRGFNQQFHDIESEFDTLSTVVGSVNTAIDNIQKLTFISSGSGISLAAGTASAELSVEVYDRTGLPANVERVYFALILPSSTAVNVTTTFQYRVQPANKMAVTLMFYNPTASLALFGFRVLGFNVQ